MKLPNTKKLLLLLLTITAALCFAFGLSACSGCNNNNGDNDQSDELSHSEGLEYTLSDDGTYYIVSGIGTCTDTAIVIPSEYNNIAVTSIGDRAFYGCDSMKKITIPDSVTSIGDEAFCYCFSLTRIMIPDSITSIGSKAFFNCLSTKNVYITDLTAWCNIDFENSSEYPYEDDYSSNPFYPVGGDLYLNGELVEDLVIPDDVTEIKDYAFINCSSLTSLTIGNNVQTIGAYAFYGHRKLYEIVIPDSVKTIGDYAFCVCDDLEEYAKGVNYTVLTIVTIGKNVESIGECAFLCCENILEINNLSSLNVVAGSYDYGYVACCAKNVYTPASGASNLITEGDFVFYNDNGSYSLIRYTGNDVILTLPDLKINGEKVSYEIDIRAFYYNYNIKCLTIPDNVTSIDSGVFYNSYIVEVYNLSSLELTAGSTNNGYVAYSAKNIYNASSGESHLITQGDYIFYNDNGAYSLVAYTGEETDLTLPELTINGENVNYKIDECAFYYNKKIESVIIPDCVTAIGEWAFCYCISLKDITIGDGVTEIGTPAFNACISLTNVYITDLTAWCNIDFGSSSGNFYWNSPLSNPFYYADNLYLNGELVEDLVIPDGITTIKDYDFN